MSQDCESLTISKEISDRITSLRFILIALVVLMHCTSSVVLKVEHKEFFSLIFKGVEHFIVDGIANSAVPCFFIFSGFLINAKKTSYSKLLQKKFFSLCVPYVLWFVVLVGVYSILYKFFQNKIEESNYFFSWDLKTFIKKFTGIKNNLFQFPIHYQFWYIRDLIIFVIGFPVIKFLIKKDSKFSLPFVTIFFCSFVYFYCIRIGFISSRSIFYFVLGMFFAEYKIDFFKVVDKLRYCQVILLFAIFLILYYLKIMWKGQINYIIYVFFATILMLKFSKFLIQREKLFFRLKKLSTYSFFVYASHVPVLTIFSVFINKVVSYKNSIRPLFVLLYFLFVLFVCTGGR